MDWFWFLFVGKTWIVRRGGKGGRGKTKNWEILSLSILSHQDARGENGSAPSMCESKKKKKDTFFEIRRNDQRLGEEKRKKRGNFSLAPPKNKEKNPATSRLDHRGEREKRS